MAKKSSKMNPFVLSAVAAVLVIGIIVLANSGIGLDFTKEEAYSISPEGVLSYGARVPLKMFNESVISDNQRFISKKVVFESHGANIYGLYIRPKVNGKIEGKIPAAVILPGAGVTKEEEAQLPNDLNDLGIATFVIDQRGVGETDGELPSLKEDYLLFLEGNETYSHKMIYDALRAFDYLAMQKDIDPSKLLMAGESFGGRNAIIATAIEPKVFGILVVGTAGLNAVTAQSENLLRFLKSIDPDNYIARISPRKIVMIHSKGDTFVPIGASVATFDKAKEPKSFIAANYTGHGYASEKMRPSLEKELIEWMLEK